MKTEYQKREGNIRACQRAIRILEAMVARPDSIACLIVGFGLKDGFEFSRLPQPEDGADFKVEIVTSSDPSEEPKKAILNQAVGDWSEIYISLMSFIEWFNLNQMRIHGEMAKERLGEMGDQSDGTA